MSVELPLLRHRPSLGTLDDISGHDGKSYIRDNARTSNWKAGAVSVGCSSLKR